jgi:hypothetical protein
VHVHVPDAWRRTPMMVYALAAGADGGDEVHPQTPIGPDVAKVELPLPAAGPWDIGLTSDFGCVLMLDVDAGSTEAVTLDARDARPVRFEATEELPLLPDGQARVGVRVDSDGDAPACPGRRDPWRVRARAGFSRGRSGETPPLRTRERLRVTVYTPPELITIDHRPTREWHAQPDLVHPGEVSTLAPRPVGSLHVSCTVALPWPESWQLASRRQADPTAIAWIQARPAEGGEARDLVWAHVAQDGGVRQPLPGLALPPGAYELVLRESSPFQPLGLPTVRVNAGEVTDVSVHLVPRPDAHPFSPGTRSPDGHMLGASAGLQTNVVLRVEGPGAGGLLALETEDGDRRTWDLEPLPSDPQPIERTIRVHRAMVLQWDRASPPIDVPPTGDVNVPMQPAAILCLVAERLPDRALGPLAVRRSDGLPLPVLPSRAWGEGSGGVGVLPESTRLRHEAPLPGPTFVGPLIAGRHELEVLLGWTVVGRLPVEVRAGSCTAVTVPVRGSPSR